MTHGEAWYNMKSSARMEDGDLQEDKPTKWPHRMNRSEAVAYYNEKLRQYWEGMLDDRIPPKLRPKALKYLIEGKIS